MYDPIKPQIDPNSACKNIYVRAYAEPARSTERSNAARPAEPRPASWFEGRFFVFDTETVAHNLTFGAFDYFDRRKRVKHAVFYADALPHDDPKGSDDCAASAATSTSRCIPSRMSSHRMCGGCARTAARSCVSMRVMT